MKLRSISLAGGKVAVVYTDGTGKTRTLATLEATAARLASIQADLDAMAHELGGHANFIRRPDGSCLLEFAPEHRDLSRMKDEALV